MKLTLVSLVFRGIRYSRFINLPYVEGRAYLSTAYLESWFNEIGIKRGQTVTI